MADVSSRLFPVDNKEYSQNSIYQKSPSIKALMQYAFIQSEHKVSLQFLDLVKKKNWFVCNNSFFNCPKARARNCNKNLLFFSSWL